MHGIGSSSYNNKPKSADEELDRVAEEIKSGLKEAWRFTKKVFVQRSPLQVCRCWTIASIVAPTQLSSYSRTRATVTTVVSRTSSMTPCPTRSGAPAARLSTRLRPRQGKLPLFVSR